MTSLSLGKGVMTGASLYTPINLELTNTLCYQTVSHLELTHKTLTKLTSDELLRDISFNNDIEFVRRFSFLFNKVEETYSVIVKFLEAH